MDLPHIQWLHNISVTLQLRNTLPTVLFYFFHKSADIFIALGVCSGSLGGAGPLPLHHHRLLAAQDGAGSADGSHAQVRAVLVLADHVPDTAKGGPGILVDGSPHVGGGRLSLAWGWAAGSVRWSRSSCTSQG